MQISIIQTEAADFVKINICVILKTFGHDCRATFSSTFSSRFLAILQGKTAPAPSS
jgi:hypothetical protein